KGNQKAFSNTAIDCITFPISNTEPFPDLIGPIRDNAVRVDGHTGRISQPDLLILPPQILFSADFLQITSFQMPVNGRCTDGKSRVVDWKAMCNLFRAPKAFQALDNIPVHKSTGFQRSSRLAAVVSANSIKKLSPPMVVPVTIVWLVLWLLTGTIPPNLSADRRGASAQKAGNFPYTVALAQKFL